MIKKTAWLFSFIFFDVIESLMISGVAWMELAFQTVL